MQKFGASLSSLGLLETVGSMIANHVPEQLQTMLFAVIPEEIEAELKHPLNAHIKSPYQISA